MNDDDEWEEEEQFVVAELSGMISPEFLSNHQGTCKIVDIESAQPVMQVGRYVFTGEYEDAIGTCVIFEETRGESNTALKYKCQTMKRLVLQRTFLSERKADEPPGTGIETLVLHEDEAFGRKIAVCHNLDPTEHPLPGESRDWSAVGHSSDLEEHVVTGQPEG